MRRPSRVTVVGVALVGAAALVYWLSNRSFDAGRGDFFYLADAFLNGRTWLDFRPGGWDVIPVGDRFYVPFAPFPAIAFMPLVALIGAPAADQIESGINAAIAAFDVGLCWFLVGRLGVARIVDRFWITVLFAFSTVLWWVATRGGVWHTGHLIATGLTFACLIELWGKQRAWLIGLLAGAAFLTRPPLAFAIPFYALMLESRAIQQPPAIVGGYLTAALTRWPIRSWALLTLGVVPSIAFFFWYNIARFDNPLESGYALAALPPFLEAQRQAGLFSLTHVGMNLNYLFLHLPVRIEDPPFFRPDGLGLSVFLTSPGLLLAATAPWRSTRTVLLLGAAVAALIPTLLYYGGGWLQYGYRYFLDSIPFLIALAGIAVARRPGLATAWKAVIAFGMLVNLVGVYWAYRI